MLGHISSISPCKMFREMKMSAVLDYIIIFYSLVCPFASVFSRLYRRIGEIQRAGACSEGREEVFVSVALSGTTGFFCAGAFLWGCFITAWGGKGVTF
ncbi:hypothetical protein TNCT_200871 [Trichonephila clavata]|uniref:Uncharacterized protein n=1 Tax=Trichonephila clavata TaxID=2740835 RepID=A0A8X6G1K2_TRICU|nr:hypothetical protein TNCT_200871 [Trichonephila clavata]